MAFTGMVGKALARQLLTRQVKQNAAKVAAQANPLAGNGGHSGKFLFVAHPNCCERCKLLGMTPHFFNTPDVAFITHPNCLCATIEAPAGLSPAQLMAWAANPVGEMKFGWNYGQHLTPINITQRNRVTQMLKYVNRVRPDAIGSTRKMRKIRAKVSEEQKELIRNAVANGELGSAKDLTNRILGNIKRIETLKKKKESRIPVRRAEIRKRKGRIETLKNNGTTTWIPQPMPRKPSGGTKKAERIYTDVKRTKNVGNSSVKPRNKKGGYAGGGGYSASDEAKEKMKREKERLKLLKKYGFV